MEKTKDSFVNVLKKAQHLGYAEPINPKLDLNGQDALSKIRIFSIDKSPVRLDTDLGFKQSRFSFSGTRCVCVSTIKTVCLCFLYEEMKFFGGNKEYVNFFIIKPV